MSRKKKAGVVVGGTLAVLVAASPLAFADTTSRSPECTFDAAADNSVEQEAIGGSALLGLEGGAASNVVDVVNVQTQEPLLSCNNVEDVVDVSITDNVQDNSEDSDVESSSVVDSFNTED